MPGDFYDIGFDLVRLGFDLRLVEQPKLGVVENTFTRRAEALREQQPDLFVQRFNLRVTLPPCVRIDVASSCPEVQGGRGSKNAVFRGAESEGGRTCSGR